MSKKDDIKAKVKFFQSFIMLLATTLFAIFGYAATNYKKFDWVLGTITIAGIIFLLIAIYIFVKYYIKYTNKLRKLK